MRRSSERRPRPQATEPDRRPLLDRLLELVLLALVAGTPLLVHTGNTDAFRVVQSFYSAVGTTLAAALWLVVVAGTAGWPDLARLPLLRLLGLFLGWCLLSTALSSAPALSLRDWLHLALQGVLFLILAERRAHWPQLEGRLVAALLLPFVLNAGLSLMQLGRFEFRTLPLPLRETLLSLDASARVGRATGLQGNENVLGNYLVAVLPMAVALGLASLPRWQRVGAALAAVLGAAAIVATLTRGAWLAMAVSVSFLAVLFLRQSWAQIRWRSVLATAAGLGLAVAGMIAASGLSPSQLGQRLRFSGQAAATVEERVVVWSIAVRMARDHPGLGLGLGTFPLHYFRYLSRHFQAQGVPRQLEARFEQAHNEALQLAAEAGGPALLLGLSLCAALAWHARRRLRHASPGSRDWAVASGSAAGLLSLAVASLFGFPLRTPASALVCTVLAGLLVDRAGAEPRRQAEPRPGALIGPGLAAGVAAALLLFDLCRVFQADRLSRQGMELFRRDRKVESRLSFERAVALDSARGDARLVLAILYRDQGLLQQSLQSFGQALQSFDDAPLHLYLGQTYEASGDRVSARREYLTVKSYSASGSRLHGLAQAHLEKLGGHKP